MSVTAINPSRPETIKFETEFRVANLVEGGTDERFVNSAFLGGMRESDYTRGLSSDTFYAMARQAWRGILRDFETVIAHVPGDPAEMQGFVTFGKDDMGTPCIAWLYVAKSWRRAGISRQLLAKAGVIPSPQPFPVLFATPQKLANYRAKGYMPSFRPYLHWRWLDESTMRGAR